MLTAGWAALSPPIPVGLGRLIRRILVCPAMPVLQPVVVAAPLAAAAAQEAEQKEEADDPQERPEESESAVAPMRAGVVHDRHWLAGGDNRTTRVSDALGHSGLVDIDADQCDKPDEDQRSDGSKNCARKKFWFVGSVIPKRRIFFASPSARMRKQTHC